jgi:plasmid stability protein
MPASQLISKSEFLSSLPPWRRWLNLDLAAIAPPPWQAASVLSEPFGSMAQLLVRHLEPAVKEALQRRARRHGLSMEEEVRQILGKAVQEEAGMPLSAGLGSTIAALFADAALELPIPEWRGEEPQAAPLES